MNTRRPAAAFVRVQYGKEDGSALWVCYPIFRRGFNGALRGVVSALFLPSFMPDEVMGGSGDAGILSFEALSPEAPSRSLAQWELEGRPEYRFIRPLYAFDGAFAAVLRPGASFLKYHQLRMGLFTSLTGILMTLALVFFVAVTANRRELLEKLVAQRTSELRESESRHRLAGHIYRSLSEGIVVTDPQGYILDGNAALGISPAIRSTKYGRASEYVFRAAKTGRTRPSGSILREHGSWQGETWNRRKDGESLPRMAVDGERGTDGNGEVTHYAGVLTHIGDIKSEHSVLAIAYHDSLTGLPNRLLLADRPKWRCSAHAANTRTSRCSFSTSTASRRSTTRTDTRPATSCSFRSPADSTRRCGSRIRSPDWGRRVHSPLRGAWRRRGGAFARQEGGCAVRRAVCRRRSSVPLQRQRGWPFTVPGTGRRRRRCLRSPICGCTKQRRSERPRRPSRAAGREQCA